MYYTVYKDAIASLEIALNELNIGYYSRTKHPAVFNHKWGTHKFDKRNESKVREYLATIGRSITFCHHSVY